MIKFEEKHVKDENKTFESFKKWRKCSLVNIEQKLAMYEIMLLNAYKLGDSGERERVYSLLDDDIRRLAKEHMQDCERIIEVNS